MNIFINQLIGNDDTLSVTYAEIRHETHL